MINSLWVAVGLEPLFAAVRPPWEWITAGDRRPQSPYAARDPTASFRHHGSHYPLCATIPLEVEEHFVRCSPPIEREAAGAAQEFDPHGLTERLPVDPWTNFEPRLQCLKRLCAPVVGGVDSPTESVRPVLTDDVASPPPAIIHLIDAHASLPFWIRVLRRGTNRTTAPENRRRRSSPPVRITGGAYYR